MLSKVNIQTSLPTASMLINVKVLTVCMLRNVEIETTKKY